MLITKFAYNNKKNTSTGHTSFKLNFGYYSLILYKKNVDSYSKSKLANKLEVKLKKLMIVYWENLYHAQEF